MNHSMMHHPAAASTPSVLTAVVDHMMNASMVSMVNGTTGHHDHHDHHHMHGNASGTPGVDIPMHNHNHSHTGGTGSTAGTGGHEGHGTGGHEGHGTGGHDGHAGHLNMDMDMHGMKMYFHDGVNEYVLFKECETKTTEALIGACFAVFAVAVLYEGLKYFRESLLQRSLIQAQSGVRYLDGKQTPGSSHEQMVMQAGNTGLNRMLSGGHFVQTFLHMVQVFVSYCLMLVFMTYNVWLCLAVVVGAGVGYFLFGWKRAVVVDTNEHCH
ncbi:high affinity copper uptake protein 1 [Elysia marginata]|uniref:Copper transport protein n=1 Tax=Elysia marginata TaxID=1093978 RepID=A0AAV4ETC4_9GAST|nr:high affinity copper uptake protein 1 [Elysia marginata]